MGKLTDEFNNLDSTLVSRVRRAVVESGSDVNEPDKYGRTAFFFSCV